MGWAGSMIVLGLLPDWIVNWLSPVWLLGVGCLAGLLLAALVLGAIWLLGTLAGPESTPGRWAQEIPVQLTEGFLFPFLLITAAVALFGIVGIFVARDPGAVITSMPELLQRERQASVVEVAPTPRDATGDPDESKEQSVPVNWRRNRLFQLEVETTQRLSVFAQAFDANVPVRVELEASPTQAGQWRRGEQSVWFNENQIENLYVVNYSDQPATMTLIAHLQPEYPQTSLVVITAIGVFLTIIFYFLQSILAPRVSAIALATFKSEVAQPLFAILLLIGIVSLLAFNWIPYNTFGEDIKMLKDTGMVLIRVLAILLAVWAASNSVAEEIEGRTALTVLSKPVGRRSFIIGKFLGITWTVALLFVVLGVVLLVIVAYKPIYDARESARELPPWQECHMEMVRTVPGLVLGFLETVVLTALSVAISTRLPMLPNFVISFGVYVLGHIIPLLAHSTEKGFAVIQFFGQLISGVFPNLDHFSIEAAISTGRQVPWSYLGWSLVYCAVFSLMATLLALLFFEDRDLA